MVAIAAMMLCAVRLGKTISTVLPDGKIQLALFTSFILGSSAATRPRLTSARAG